MEHDLDIRSQDLRQQQGMSVGKVPLLPNIFNKNILHSVTYSALLLLQPFCFSTPFTKKFSSCNSTKAESIIGLKNQPSTAITGLASYSLLVNIPPKLVCSVSFEHALLARLSRNRRR